MAEKGLLTVEGPFETTDVRVFDAAMREVAAGTHGVQTELDPGIYRVVAQVPGSSEEKLVIVEAGKPANVSGFTLEWDSVTPHDNSRSHHEYQTDPVVRMSRETHADLGGNARLLVYIRTQGGPGTGVPSFQILNEAGTTCASFPEVGEHDLGAGWLGCSLTMPAGTYHIEHTVPGLGRRAQAIFVDDGWQTQAFVPWRESPDFSAAVLHMRPRNAGFQPSMSWEYTRTEAALDGLADRRVIFHPGEIDAFLHGKFRDPMLGLIGAYALLLQGNVDCSKLEIIATNLLRLIPHSPDARLLHFMARTRCAIPPPEPDTGWPVFTEPPLFALGCDRLLDVASHVKEVCPADSWLGRISMSRSTGSAWTRWDPTLNASEALTRLKNAIDARTRDSQHVLDMLVENLADSLSAATLRVLKPHKIAPALKDLMKQAGPPLVRWLEEAGVVNIEAINEHTANAMAIELAPELQLPQSVTADALKTLLNEAMPGFRRRKSPSAARGRARTTTMTGAQKGAARSPVARAKKAATSSAGGRLPAAGGSRRAGSKKAAAKRATQRAQPGKKAQKSNGRKKAQPPKTQKKGRKR